MEGIDITVFVAMIPHVMSTLRIGLQTNRRVEVLLFMVAIAAMMRGVIKLLLRRNRARGSPVPNGVTVKRFFFLTSNMFIEVDRSDGMIVLDGSDDDCIMLEEACAALDPDS